MADSLRRIARGQVCPICGHKDWCGDRDDNTYGHIWLCHRYDGRVDHVGVVKKLYGGKDAKEVTNTYTIVDGSDGRYVLIPNSGNKSCSNFYRYEEWYNYIQGNLQEFERKNAEYASEHGYDYKKRSSFEVDGCEERDEGYVFVPVKREKWKMDPEIVEPLNHDTLNQIFREWLPCFILSRWHYRKLMKEWDVSDKPGVAEVFDPRMIFDTWMIKTMPPEDHIRSTAPDFYKMLAEGPTRKQLMDCLVKICAKLGLSSPAGIPGIYYDTKKDEWKMLSRSGIIYPVYDAQGRIYRLRIGVDFPDVEGLLNGKEGIFRFWKDTWFFDRDDKPFGEKSVIAWKYGNSRNLISLSAKGLPPGKSKGKYVNFSSFVEQRIEEAHLITNKYKYGCQCGGSISVYRPKNGKTRVVWITEGEKKAMVMAAVLGCTVICLPGVSSYARIFEPVEEGESVFETLVREGAIMFVVAFDADKEQNSDVKKAEDGLTRELWSHGARMINVTEWHGEFGKGMDDMLLEGAMPDFRQITF